MLDYVELHETLPSEYFVRHYGYSYRCCYSCYIWWPQHHNCGFCRRFPHYKHLHYDGIKCWMLSSATASAVEASMTTQVSPKFISFEPLPIRFCLLLFFGRYGTTTGQYEKKRNSKVSQAQVRLTGLHECVKASDVESGRKSVEEKDEADGEQQQGSTIAHRCQHVSRHICVRHRHG